MNEPGAWSWNELLTRDLDASRSFYREVFGWDTQLAEGLPPGVEYHLLQVEGQRWPEGLGGMMRIGEEMPPEMPSYWGVYFRVEDCDATAARAGELGGSVQVEPQDISVGRFAALADPQGAHFSVIKSAMTEAR